MASGKKNADIDSRRLFIAIILPEDLRVQLFESIKELADHVPAVRPISPENIHLTLKFLGSTGTFMLREITSAIRNTAEGFESFSFAAGSIIGAFPNISSARILYVPVVDAAGHVADIFKVLEDNLATIKIKREERKFTPHITIARIKDELNIADFLKKITFDFKDGIICSKLTLFESRLKPSGADYIILEEFALK
jgi:2''-5'' RNA ligase